MNVAKTLAEEYEVISGVLATFGVLLSALFWRFGSGGGEGVASSAGCCAICTDGP